MGVQVAALIPLKCSARCAVPCFRASFVHWALSESRNSMKLYTFDGSPTSRVVLLFCAEEGIAFEKVDVDLLAGAHLSEKFKQINPCAFVPVLEDGDLRLTESSAILKYLADKSESK